MRISRGIALPVLCCIGLAHAGSPASLCDSTETVLFSCSIGRKLASVCASQDLLVNSGYVKYRFGRLGQKPELEYPERDLSVQQAFVYGHDSFTKGHSESLSFSRGKYSYFINYDTGVFDGTSGEVVVVSGKVPATTLTCTSEPVENLHLLYEIGMPTYSLDMRPDMYSSGTSR